jgi:hypothetical protein
MMDAFSRAGSALLPSLSVHSKHICELHVSTGLPQQNVPAAAHCKANCRQEMFHTCHSGFGTGVRLSERYATATSNCSRQYDNEHSKKLYNDEIRRLVVNRVIPTACRSTHSRVES